VHGLERSRSWPLLLRLHRSRRFADHAALRNEDDAADKAVRSAAEMTGASSALSVGELLLQLARQAVAEVSSCCPSSWSARAHRPWILWKALSCGTGTKMTMAFLPPLTSTSFAELICRGRSSALR
jgi:hypothetical protein